MRWSRSRYSLVRTAPRVTASPTQATTLITSMTRYREVDYVKDDVRGREGVGDA